jgi:hypothetical protein
MSIHRIEEGVFKMRWREGGRNRSLNVHGSHELAKKNSSEEAVGAG